MRVRFEDRLFVVGATGSGKSTLAEQVVRGIPGPRLIFDPADSTLTDLPGARTVHGPRNAGRDLLAGEVHRALSAARADGAEVLRYVPGDPTNPAETDAVYAWAFDRFPLFVWLDEAGIAAPATGAPKQVSRYLVQGRKRRLGHLACHTRPVEVARNLIAQSQHVAIFEIPHPDDRAMLAKVIGLPVPVLERELAHLPKYGFLWWDVSRRELTVVAEGVDLSPAA